MTLKTPSLVVLRHLTHANYLTEAALMKKYCKTLIDAPTNQHLRNTP